MPRPVSFIFALVSPANDSLTIVALSESYHTTQMKYQVDSAGIKVLIAVNLPFCMPVILFAHFANLGSRTLNKT